MNALNSALGPIHMQATIPEINLSPTKRAKLLRSEAVSVSQ